MATKTETALEALRTVLTGLADVNVRRNPTLASAFGAGSLIALLDGTPEETGRRFGNPVVLEFEHMAVLEIAVIGKSDALRQSAMNALVTLIGNALHADRKLGGAVDYLSFDPPADPVTDLFAGTEDLLGVSIDVTLYYETSENPMEAV